MTEHTDVRTKLVARLAELRRVNAVVVEDTAPGKMNASTLDRLTRVDSMQDHAVAQAVEGRRRLAIRRIEATIVRIDEDEYGMCIKCGETIPGARLDADATVTHCITCAPLK